MIPFTMTIIIRLHDRAAKLWGPVRARRVAEQPPGSPASSVSLSVVHFKFKLYSEVIARIYILSAWRAAPGGGLAWWFIVHEHRQPWWVAAASVLRLIKETA